MDEEYRKSLDIVDEVEYRRKWEREEFVFFNVQEAKGKVKVEI